MRRRCLLKEGEYRQVQDEKEMFIKGRRVYAGSRGEGDVC